MNAGFVQGLPLLVVDDDDAHRQRLVRAFCERGVDAYGASGYQEAIGFARRSVVGSAIVDLKMPGKHGLDVVRDVLVLHRDARIVVLTAYGSIATAVEAMRLGAVNYLTKPSDVDRILAAFVGSTHEMGGPDIVGTPSLARVEWEHIERVLRDCEGNISKAARTLGIPRRSLQYKLAKNPVSK